MLLKTICIIYIISTLSSFSDGNTLSTSNETNLVLDISLQQSKLREELDLQRKITNELVKESDIGELQDRFIDRLVKAMDIQSLRADTQLLRRDTQSLRADTQLLRVEQERQGKLIVDGLVKDLDTPSLKAEQERQGKLISDEMKELNQLQLMMYPTNCTEEKFSGIYYLLLPSYTHDGGWTIILRRLDGSVNFYRNWTEYEKGFGDLRGEFFIGLDKLHALTIERSQELLVVLEDFEGIEAFEKYDEFAIGGEDEAYKLHTLGKASGTGDSLEYHRGMKFLTFDRDNDNNEGNCAKDFTGAWWYNSCHLSQLTGTYNDTTFGKGVVWNRFRGLSYSLKKALMMIRPRK